MSLQTIGVSFAICALLYGGYFWWVVMRLRRGEQPQVTNTLAVLEPSDKDE